MGVAETIESRCVVSEGGVQGPAKTSVGVVLSLRQSQELLKTHPPPSAASSIEGKEK